MHFSHISNDKGSKLTKIAIVTALHLAVGLALVKSMNHVSISQLIPDDVVVEFIPDKVIVPPPPPPPTIEQTRATITPPPPVFVPQPEIEVTRTVVEPTVTATSDPLPVKYNPGPPQITPEVKVAPTTSAAMRTAVLADAAGCTKPDYPARAARNGETGTVSLALLVASDGRVADSRIQKSSGYRDLDRAAIAALSTCKFKPATNGGVPEQGWAQIAYVWTLDA